MQNDYPLTISAPLKQTEYRRSAREVVYGNARHTVPALRQGGWLPERMMVSGEALPKTSTGKLDKKPLRQKYSYVLGVV